MFRLIVVMVWCFCVGWRISLMVVNLVVVNIVVFYLVGFIYVVDW